MKHWINGLRWVIGTVLLGSTLAMGLIGIAFSDKYESENEHSYSSKAGAASMEAGWQKAAQSYQEECSACHIAYPTDFLPSRSWSQIMATLDQHFGDNAELMPDVHQDVATYLQAFAADAGQSRMQSRVMRGVNLAEPPLRITEMPFYTRIHHEIPDRYVGGNPEVGSFSQCQACHGDAAERGLFDEDSVNIPGAPHWDDD
ncbi:diheme cytochrome c [Reinekea blandensis]|uniref:Diheme cytochrome c n=1 Tax=Reinekea blandensis MED297 TaxID=314283 RepID=A4BGK7_9GAMM|nr:diheme cytochrome c [Reinekea blandensis]EAR08813.1 diheme cytochrome c [Reinekea sp. MED297] [Reinekea blandensis MED297]